jgi:UDP-N-acetylglucosamine--N-acetylmuramyl-(pentapeptide) pyrophosphoryl-undecaprenol N-acetylglucosamine transferase
LRLDVEVRSFFADLPMRIAKAHLIIARGGASTVSELAVIGRPSILVPLPNALDQDQTANAGQLAEAGAAIVVRQIEFTPESLADMLVQLLDDPAGLRHRAAAAKTIGIADAADRLAELVLQIASVKKVET